MMHLIITGKSVLAVDVPSGVESPRAVEASWTCTAAARKIPCATGHGSAVSGEIVSIILDERAESLLGVPYALELEKRDVCEFMPKHQTDDHKKGSYNGSHTGCKSVKTVGKVLCALGLALLFWLQLQKFAMHCLLYCRNVSQSLWTTLRSCAM